MNWEPINTAPKDGSRVVVLWLGKVTIATWWDNDGFADGTAKFGTAAWQEFPDGDFDTGGEVTHWLPLPTLPNA